MRQDKRKRKRPYLSEMQETLHSSNHPTLILLVQTFLSRFINKFYRWKRQMVIIPTSGLLLNLPIRITKGCHIINGLMWLATKGTFNLHSKLNVAAKLNDHKKTFNQMRDPLTLFFRHFIWKHCSTIYEERPEFHINQKKLCHMTRPIINII